MTTKIDLHIKWLVRFNRASNKIEISMFEQFDNNPYLIAVAAEGSVRIWPWDNEDSVRNKVVDKQTRMYSRYLATKDFNEHIFKLCQVVSEGVQFIGKHTISGEFPPKGPPPPPKTRKPLPKLEKIRNNTKSPEIVSMQDYKNNKKD